MTLYIRINEINKGLVNDDLAIPSSLYYNKNNSISKFYNINNEDKVIDDKIFNKLLDEVVYQDTKIKKYTKHNNKIKKNKTRKKDKK